MIITPEQMREIVRKVVREERLRYLNLKANQISALMEIHVDDRHLAQEYSITITTAQKLERDL